MTASLSAYVSLLTTEKLLVVRTYKARKANRKGNWPPFGSVEMQIRLPTDLGQTPVHKKGL